MHIFISYRRDDSAAAARLIHNELCQRFGDRSVFMDLDDIGWGDDFGRVIDDHLRRADVVLVIVGPRWAELLQQRLRGDDWVRHEVRVALEGMGEGRTRVLPVRVAGAPWPCAALPPDIAQLGALDAREIRDRELKSGIAALVEAVQARSFEDIARDDRRRRWLVRAAVVLGLAVFMAGWTSLFDELSLDARVHELTMRLAHMLPGDRSPRPSGKVVLVAIDAASVVAAGRPYGPEWREDVATVVQRVADAGARVLAFDIKFENPGNESGSAALERALATARARLRVVVAVQGLTPDGEPRLLPRLRPHVSWGIACVGERDDVTRTLPLVLRRGQGDRLVPFLALAAYVGGDHGTLHALDALDLELSVKPVDDGHDVGVRGYSAETVRASHRDCPAVQAGDLVVHQLLDARAVPLLRGNVKRLSFHDVLRGDAAALQALNERYVIVGLLTGDDDLHATAVGGRYGVELIAAQLEELLTGRAIRPLPWYIQVFLMTALAVAGTALGLRGRRARWVWPAVALLGGAYALAGVLWYRSHQELASVHYGIAALLLGSSLARRMTRR